MGITLERARSLKYRQILIDDGGNKWRVNGQVQTWKRDSGRIRVPLKHGLYTFGELTEKNLDRFSFPE